MRSFKKTTIASLTLAAGLSTLALAGATQAQVNNSAPAARSAPAAPTADRRAQMEQRMAERRAARAKDLATVLRLRPDQMPALNTFLDSQRPNAGQMGRTPGARPAPPAANAAPPTTPQRLDRMAERTQQRQARMQQRTQALRTFYAALTPEQQQSFDALGRLRGGPEARGGGRRGPGGGEHRGGRMMGRGGPGGPPAASR